LPASTTVLLYNFDPPPKGACAIVERVPDVSVKFGREL
jgi:hypothetical protein